jgi:uncharacterized protein YqeY
MALINTIKDQIVEARKTNKPELLKILTTFYGEASAIGKTNGNRETYDSEVISLAKKFIVAINQNLEIIEKDTSRINLKPELLYEKAILQKYIPKQISDEKLELTIKEIIDSVPEVLATSPKLIGYIMKELKSQFGDRFDSKKANEIIKGLIS